MQATSRAHVGDEIVVAGHAVGQQPRVGKVLEALQGRTRALPGPLGGRPRVDPHSLERRDYPRAAAQETVRPGGGAAWRAAA